MSKKASKVYPNAGFTELINRIDSDTGLIFVDTPEETRVIREVFRNYQNSASVQFWSFGHGLHEIKNEDDPNLFYPHQYQRSRARTDKSGNAKSPLGIVQALTIIEEDCYDKIKPGEEVYKKTIYILRDADKFLQNSPPYVRAFRDIVYLASCTSSCIVITGFGLTVPDDLTKDSAYVKLPYPNMDEIRSVYIPMLKNKIEFHNKTATPENKISEKFDEEAIARACAGLTEDQILNVFQYSTSIDKAVSINRILEEKKSIINKSDILQYWICNDTLSDVGGFSSLKEWFGARKVIIDHPDEASKFSARYPSCIMLLGMQGSGKSHIAKAVAQDWGQGLIEFNTGKIFAGLVGESEKRARQALAQAEAAGGILVMDEVDKALSGAGSSDRTDGGTTSRVIATMLDWLQKPHPGVFLIMTANDVTNLINNHPELVRKGRIDEVWFSDAPTAEERKEIFKIHLKKNRRNPEKFDIDRLAAYEFEDDADSKTYGPTGAEIEYAISDAIQEKFGLGGGKVIEIASEGDITTDDIIEKLKVIKPISYVAKDTIRKMRAWSAKNARSVTSLPDKKKTEKKTKSKLDIRSINPTL